MAAPPVDEAAFTAEVAAEFTAAFTVVFEEHQAACLRLARRLVRDEALAHDVVQEVFLAWWRTGGGGYRAERGALGAWLSTLTHHKAVDAVRTSERHRRVAAAAVSAVARQAEERLVDEVVWWELGRQALVAALPTLPAKQRDVLSLAYVDGLTQVEIAERLDVPLGTVKSRTHAGMLRLRAAIGGTWTPAGPAAAPECAAAGGSGGGLQGAGVQGPQPTLPTTSVTPQPSKLLRDDVDLCASNLLRIAAAEDGGGLSSAAMLRQAAELFDGHGEAGLYDLVVTLARLAAAGSTVTAHGTHCVQGD